MKKIINGKKYDTDTAREVGYAETGDSNELYHWTCETLYCKRTGEYFLHGEGGGMTRYAEQIGDNWANGERIIPLSTESARKWAEENLSVDEYEHEFGEVSEEDEGKVIVTYSIKPSTRDKIKRLALDAGVPASQWLDAMVSKL